jgi:hypothetical protein
MIPLFHANARGYLRNRGVENSLTRAFQALLTNKSGFGPWPDGHLWLERLLRKAQPRDCKTIAIEDQ